MKQKLIDIVFTFLGLSLSLSPIDFIGVEGLALEGRSGKTLSTQTMTLLWAGEVGQGSLRYGLTFGLPLHVFIVLLLGWKGWFHKQHEERFLWHCFHFFSCLHYLLLISFGWEGWLALQGRSGKVSSAMVLLFLLHVFVCCCSGGRVVPQGSWSNIFLAFCSLFWMSFTIL